MQNKKLMMIAIFLVGLLAVGAVSAADIACEDNATGAIGQEPVSALSATDDNDELEITENNNLLAGPKTFTELNNKINANPSENEIYLTENYTYDANNDTAFVKGITISRSLTIFGNGVTINATDAARIFQVTGGKVVFNNITFANGRVYGVSDSGSGGAILGNGNAFAINCTFTNNFAQDSGGAMDDGNATDCIFTNNYAKYDGGAMDEGNATNCIFINNSAGGAGGAFSSGIASNCIFINNSGDGGGAFSYGISSNCIFINNFAYRGGAFSYGIASNCIFINNYAYRGGAICESNAINCTFTNNYAVKCGGAIFEGNATDCTFIINHAKDTGNHCDNLTTCVNCTEIDSAILNVSNFTTTYRSGEKLPFSLTNGTEIIKGAYTKITLLQTGEEYYAFTGQDLPVDLKIGTYDARFAIIFYNGSENPHVEPQTVKIEITSDGTTFSDLNRTINNNTDSVINLDKNYTYNPDTDSAFTNGIVIDRKVTINGNGCTIDADGKARIFNVTSGNADLKNITFANGNAKEGGAVYFYSNGSVINCNFTNNSASDYGGAIRFSSTGTVKNCNFVNNIASDSGGAISMDSGSVTNCNFTNNKATDATGFGGAISMSSGSVTNCNFVDNKVTGDYSRGGAVGLGKGEVTNCSFANNKASLGGAVYFRNTGGVTNCSFANNKAYLCGAVSFGEDGTVTNCNFTNNSASDYGGAVSFAEEGTVTDCNFTNNAATNGNGGAIYWEGNNANISNCCFVNNTATYGGANYFENDLFNSNINAEFINNNASEGGANYFNGALNNVNIKGDYTSNTANGVGGANLFRGALNNVDIIGNYTSNKANNRGGANFFAKELTNVTISGDYTKNTAQLNGGAYYFIGIITNLTIIGDYTSNTGGSSGIIIFQDSVYYLNVIGAFVNNSGQSLIHFIRPVTNSVVRDSIFLNNNVSNIIGGTRKIQIINSWFGNNATNYNEAPNAGSVTPDNWLFLNATVDPVKFTSSTNVTFKLDSYDANTKNVTDYNNSLISPIELTLTSTNATVKNSTHLNETVKYVAGDSNSGSVTATFEGAQYTIELQTDKKNPQLSIESETYNYNETITLALSYNPNATGNVSVTLNGKKHNYNYTDLALNVTVMLSSDILPDEYNVTVMYGGDVNFFGTSANSTLTVKKANSTLKISDITFDYNKTGSCEVTFTNATGVTAEVISHNEAIINVTNSMITVSGLDAGNYTLSVTTITGEGYSNVTKTSKITVKPAPSEVSAEDVNVTYGEDIIIPVKSVNATEVKYEIIMKNDVVASGTVMSGENITGLRLASGTYTVNLTAVTDSNHISSSGESLLTVKKALSSIDVNGTESYYKNDAVLNYAVVNATGINVDIVDWAGNPMKSGVDYNISITKSQIIIDFFNDGRYVANVTTITDNNHTSACMGAEIRVLPVIDLEISIAPENQTAYYGDTLSWKVIIVNHGPSMAENLYLDFFADDGIIFTDQYGKQYAKHYRFSDVYPIGVDYPFICILKTLANATDAELCFNVTVGDIYSIYPNLSKYNASASVKVEHASANISVNADSQIVVGDSLTVTVELPSDATGNVTVTIDGEKYIGTINEGIATISIPDLAAGEKTAIISYPGDNRYSPINETRDITVSRKNTTADISAPTSITLGDDASVDVKLPGDAKGNVTVIVDGEILDTVPLSNGAVDVTLPEMKAGNHTVEVIYSGDEKYNPVSETKNITVLKQNATAEVSLPENVTYGDDESVDVILPGDATGNVTVKVDGDDVGSVEVVNGSASVALPTLSAGDHAVEVVYSGDDKYAPVSQTVNVAVVKSTPKLTANKKTFKNTDKYKKYTVSLKDSKGNAIVNATVTLKVNGKTYTAKTNSNGKATFKLTKLTKTGKATITFKGNKYYTKTTKKVKLTVKSVWKTVSKGSTNSAMVKKIQRALKNNGYYLSYNGRYLMVDGKYEIYTEMAVKEFQKDHGLKVTGKVDYKTAKKLKIV